MVQLYISDLASSITRPEKQLKGFRKISLQPGDTQTVTFRVGREELEYVSADLTRIVEPGDFTVMAGPNSAEYLSAPLQVREEG